MNVIIRSPIPRRRGNSENSCLHCNYDSRPITESRKSSLENSNTYDKYILLQHAVSNFPVNNSEKLECNSYPIMEIVTNYTDRGNVDSSITKNFNISRDSNTFSFMGNELQSKCCLNLNSKPVDYEREFGYIATCNRFLQTRYGSQNLSMEYYYKHISNRKEVLINEEENNPFYSYNNSSSSSISACVLPSHNIELEMNYSPKFSFPSIINGIKLKEIKFNENLFIYLTMRNFKRNHWKYFPAHVIQLYSSLLYDDEKIIRNFECGIISHDDDKYTKRAFPLDVFRYPNMQNGEFVVSKISRNGENDQMSIERFPIDMMGLTEEELRNKCLTLF